MRPRKKIQKRRCSESHEWFEPDARAATTQDTCSAECRQLKRNRQARERRAKAPEKYREAERARQALCREKKKALEGATGPPSTQRFSAEIEQRIEGALALASPTSRAALAEAIRSLAVECLRMAIGGS
jgi:hypothetical protein